MPEPITTVFLGTSLFYGGYLLGKYTEGNLIDGMVFAGQKGFMLFNTQIAFSWKLKITPPVKSEPISKYEYKKTIQTCERTALEDVLKRPSIDEQLQQDEIFKKSMQSCLLSTNPSVGVELDVERKEEMRKSLTQRIAPVTNYVWNAGSKVGSYCGSYINTCGSYINSFRKKQE